MVYNQQLNSESKVDDIAELLPGKENFRIQARVVRMWRVPAFLNPAESISLEIVLIDEKIHASIRKQLIHMFESKIEEGQVYEISSFLVVPESGFYRTTLHPYKLLFQIRTGLKLSEDSNIKQFGFTFTDIAEICAHTHDYDYLVDVIGVMTGISAEREYIRDGKITKMVVIELTDHSGKCECALFGDYVDELNKKMGKSTGGLPIVVVQYAKVKIFREKTSIQNVINTTRLLINPDIPEIEGFKNSIAVHGIENETKVPMIGESAKPSLEHEFLRMHPKKTLQELLCLAEGGVFVVCAEVGRIIDGQDWWYPACKCHKSVIPDSSSYFCTACDKHVFNVTPRYRVKLEVTDGKSTGVFVIFDSDMSYMMEKSCSFFVAQSMGKNRGAHPVEFESLVGNKMLFAVDLSSKQTAASDGSYRVKRVCMDSKVIESFCAECPFSNASKEIYRAIDLESDVDSPSTDDCEDLHATEFAKDLIVTPPMARGKAEVSDDVAVTIKRNLTKSFDKVAKGGVKGSPEKDQS